MVDKIKRGCMKYREAIMYLIFGGLTTGVNAAVYFPCSVIFELSTGLSTVIAWVSAVIFAYITNKIWVFESKSLKLKIIVKEFFPFVSARLLSLGINFVIMVVGVDIWRLNEAAVYIFANIVVIIFNYFASKLFIFRKRDK